MQLEILHHFLHCLEFFVSDVVLLAVYGAEENWLFFWWVERAENEFVQLLLHFWPVFRIDLCPSNKPVFDHPLLLFERSSIQSVYRHHQLRHRFLITFG